MDPPIRIRQLDSRDSRMVQAQHTIGNFSDAVLALVLNAIDAKATSIRVTVDKDVFFCCVEDDGVGISNDIFAAVGEGVVRRNVPATTGSYGFHGTALLSLITLSGSAKIVSVIDGDRTSKSFSAGQIVPSGDSIPEATQKPKPAGTTVTLKNIFGVWPIRQQALVSQKGGTAKELERAKHLLLLLAHAHCRTISLSLIARRPDQNSRALLHLPRTSDLGEMVSSFLGLPHGKDAHTFSGSVPALQMKLRLASVDDWVHSKKLQFVSIDGSWTKEMQVLSHAMSQSILRLKRMCDRKLVKDGEGQLAAHENQSKALQKQGAPAFCLDISSGDANTNSSATTTATLQTLSSRVMEIIYSPALKTCFQNVVQQAFPVVPFGVVHWVCNHYLPSVEGTAGDRWSRPNSHWLRSKHMPPLTTPQVDTDVEAAANMEAYWMEALSTDIEVRSDDPHEFDILLGDGIFNDGANGLASPFDDTFFETVSPHQHVRLGWRLDECARSGKGGSTHSSAVPVLRRSPRLPRLIEADDAGMQGVQTLLFDECDLHLEKGESSPNRGTALFVLGRCFTFSVSIL
jgi:hypothetical protein